MLTWVRFFRFSIRCRISSEYFLALLQRVVHEFFSCCYQRFNDVVVEIFDGGFIDVSVIFIFNSGVSVSEFFLNSSTQNGGIRKGPG